MKEPQIQSWDDIHEDSPIQLIHRRRIFGEKTLIAKVLLEKGCHVAPHHHDSEQIAYVVSGRVRWSLGEPGTSEFRNAETGAGEVVVLPSNFVHGVDALEDTIIIDVLSPPGEMGVDSQDSHSR